MRKYGKDSLENLTVNELENLLNCELKKPAILIDSKLVDNLTYVLCSKEKLKVAPASDEEISEIVQNIVSNERKAVRKKQRIACKISACAAALLIGLNVCTVSAYNENIFSLLVEFTKGGVLVQFNKPQKEEIIIPISPDDPYGIIAKCKENGIENIETPHYLPEGFILTEFEADTENDYCHFVGFTYENGDQLISLSFDEFLDGIPEEIGIPSDEHNISEIEINGHPAIMSMEDNQMIVIFNLGKKIVEIFTQDVDYSECDKILESYRLN